MKYTLKDYGTKESFRESLEYDAQQKRVEAKVLCAEALVMENLARKIFCCLEEVEEELP